MSRRNPRAQQPSLPLPLPLPPAESSEGSEEADHTAPRQGRAGHQPRRRRRARQDVGEEIDITLTDKNLSIPSQPNSQTAPPVRLQTSNSQPLQTPTSSQGDSCSQTSVNVNHFFRKARGTETVCTYCK